jgi:hypothetical protein
VRTPLTPDVKSRPYLSIIPTRSPEQKTHTSLGHAKNAVNNKIWSGYSHRHDMAIYEWVDNDWKLLYDIPAGTTENNLPWRK